LLCFALLCFALLSCDYLSLAFLFFPSSHFQKELLMKEVALEFSSYWDQISQIVLQKVLSISSLGNFEETWISNFLSPLSGRVFFNKNISSERIFNWGNLCQHSEERLEEGTWAQAHSFGSISSLAIQKTDEERQNSKKRQINIRQSSVFSSIRTLSLR